ncbi:unnamed protein product [Polarella glacialis]|uniref:Uncharacterized protein n=1 Tax=Polarella glacialis TaxID=89957 RepID=A0A813FPA8_POLGL|nr:unnamed protein product [Polarella glacialis]
MLWRKQTRIRGNRVWVESLAAKCPGCKSHQRLRDSTCREGNWKPWTAVASSYPGRLVSCWSKFVVDDVGVRSDKKQQREQLLHAFRSGVQSTESDLTPLPGANLNLVGLGNDRLLTVDRVARYSHIGIYLTLGCDQSKVQETASAWITLIRDSGFIVKDDPIVAELEKYIGYSSQVTPARVKLPVKTLVRLDFALNFLVKQKWVFATTIQSVLGLLVWAFLLKRPLLSIFFDIYGRVRSTEYKQWGWMIAGLRAELLAARRILPLCYADCHRLVLPFVMAQDAEGEGEGGLGGWGLGVAAPPVK